MSRTVWRRSCFAGVFFSAVCLTSPFAAEHQYHLEGGRSIRHVLLISVDGMHALDFIDCAHGMKGVNNGNPYCPNIAALARTGVTYLDASTPKPSDSFPGLMALVAGGSPRTVGAFYDVAYDRSLDPPEITTGNGLAGGECGPGAPPTGTRTEYEEGIDIDQTKLNGGAPNGVSGGILSIDPRKLVRDPSKGCAPVYPWNFVRTNTIFGIIRASGGYTAWSDKHPSYSAVSGPGDGHNVNDYYSPEINSRVINLPGITTPLGMSCAIVPDPSQTKSWDASFQNVQCYDTLKVNAILSEIDGKKHDGKGSAQVPTVFGLNFQAVSIGQKLIEKNVARGGYLDAAGTPSAELLKEIQFTDASIGEIVGRLRSRSLLDSTLLIVTAKHGQNPVDSSRFYEPATTPATILDSYLPDSEKPSNHKEIGPTEDDISLIWLADPNQVEKAVDLLETTSPRSNNVAGIGQILWGPAITQMFNSPSIDPRTPDIVVIPDVGVVYSGSSKKLAEHGGFSRDDTNVMMLLSNPQFSAKTIASPVETMQVAPTILDALGLDPRALQAVREEGTQVLPGVRFEGGKK